jgi:RNA polymerase sigma factor (sigma-70 family)
MRTVTRAQEDIKDLVAQTVMRAWVAQPPIEARRDPEDALIDLARAARRDYAHRHPAGRLAHGGDLSWVAARDRGDREALSPQEAAERREWLCRQLAILPKGERDAVDRHVLRGMSCRAVAEDLGCTEGAVRVRVHRGMKRLRGHRADDPFPADGEGVP